MSHFIKGIALKMEHRRLSRFLKEFDYTPCGYRLGTVVVEGKEYIIDYDFEKEDVEYPTLTCASGMDTASRSTFACVSADRRYIVVGHEMLRVPYRLGMAVLMHEIGHLELENPFIHGNRCRVQTRMAYEKKALHAVERSDVGYDAYDPWVTYESNPKSDAAREEAHKHATTLEVERFAAGGMDASDFEADQYAANRVGHLTMAISLILVAAYTLRSVGVSLQHIKITVDLLKNRIGALYDKGMRSSDVYK